jgi:hypothetical protein
MDRNKTRSILVVMDMTQDNERNTMRLSERQVAKARRMAVRDYEIRSYLNAYLAGSASSQTIALLLEEIGEEQ